MEDDMELQAHLSSLQRRGAAQLAREERLQRQRSLDAAGLPSFNSVMQQNGCSVPLRRGTTKVLQLNIGLYCNQACTHCHVESSPRRTESMDAATADRCLQLLRSSTSVNTLDITGGAPELHRQFRPLVEAVSALGGIEIIDRCNLTVLLEPGQEDLPQFLAQHRVRVVASLPCYSQSNVDKQRGAGVFERSIEALQILNRLGYGQEGSGLTLDLVYNPGGAFLAPSQEQLQDSYRRELREAYGIEFTSLLCLNNMPIKRFADFLSRQGMMEEYLRMLVNSFNPRAAESVMCRDTVSVGWDGQLYDCDFNQQLGMGLSSVSSTGIGEGGVPGGKQHLSVFDVESLAELEGQAVRVDNHCYGCTAGSGSSCQGAVA